MIDYKDLKGGIGGIVDLVDLLPRPRFLPFLELLAPWYSQFSDVVNRPRLRCEGSNI